MKFSSIIFVVLMFIMDTPKSNAGWFGNNDDQQKINNLETQLQQQQRTNVGLEIVIMVLGAGVLVALISGTIIGSRTRRAAKHHEQPGE